MTSFAKFVKILHYSSSLAVFMLPKWSWYCSVHFRGRGFRKLLNFRSMFDSWPLNSRSRAILHDLLYLHLYSSYQTDLGVYFHIIEVSDHNNDKINTATITVGLQIQGHALSRITSHISGCTRAIGKILVSSSTLLRSQITTIKTLTYYLTTNKIIIK